MTCAPSSEGAERACDRCDNASLRAGSPLRGARRQCNAGRISAASNAPQLFAAQGVNGGAPAGSRAALGSVYGTVIGPQRSNRSLSAGGDASGKVIATPACAQARVLASCRAAAVTRTSFASLAACMSPHTRLVCMLPCQPGRGQSGREQAGRSREAGSRHPSRVAPTVALAEADSMGIGSRRATPEMRMRGSVASKAMHGGGRGSGGAAAGGSRAAAGSWGREAACVANRCAGGVLVAVR